MMHSTTPLVFDLDCNNTRADAHHPIGLSPTHEVFRSMNDAFDVSADPQQALRIAQSVMGNRTKSVIVRHLWIHGPSTGSSICRENEISGPTFSLAMQQLEKWDLVHGSIPSVQRHGRAVTYTLDQSKIRALVQLWFDFVQGHMGEQTKDS